MIREKLMQLDLEKIEEIKNNINWSVIALDTETSSLKWSEQELEEVSICDSNYAIVVSKEVFDRLYPSIIEKTKIIICHNIVFDMKVLYKFGYDLFDKEWIDTMVMSHLCNENREHGLKYLAKELLGYVVMSYVEAKKNREIFLDYAINDAIYTYELSTYFKPILIEEKLDKLFRKIEMPFLKVLARMEMNGVLMDGEKIVTITNELSELIIELEIEMLTSLNEKYDLQYNLNGDFFIESRINFNSNDQLAEILFNRLGLNPAKLTGKGKASVGKETINILKKQHPFVEVLAKYKAAQKLLNAFFNPMPDFMDSDNRIRPHFNDCGTATGRLSCSNPNLQQLPRHNEKLGINTRSCFIADQGNKMIAIDYSQQELRIMAQLSRDENIIKIINEGGDLHLINANNVFNLGIPEEKLYSTHPEYEDVKDLYKKEREWGKTFSFGVSYGMGPHKLSRDFNVGLEEAQDMLDRYFIGFPQLKKAIDSTHKFAEDNQYVATYLGRRRRFVLNEWGKLDSKSLRQAFNFLIQSLGADMIRVACIKLQEYADKNRHMDIKLLMTVHDEILIECKEEYAKEVATIAEQLLESAAKGFICPLKAEAGIGGNYGEAK